MNYVFVSIYSISRLLISLCVCYHTKVLKNVFKKIFFNLLALQHEFLTPPGSVKNALCLGRWEYV